VGSGLGKPLKIEKKVPFEMPKPNFPKISPRGESKGKLKQELKGERGANTTHSSAQAPPKGSFKLPRPAGAGGK